MAVIPRRLRIYASTNGRIPFSEWLDSLADDLAYAAITVRLDRIRFGNFGDCRFIDDGLAELRIHFGPGYRVYFGEDGKDIVLLLCGGTKRTQTADIARAERYWQDYRSRKNG